MSDGGMVSREEASLYLTFENGAPGIGKPWGEDPDLYQLSPLTLIYSNLAALPRPVLGAQYSQVPIPMPLFMPRELLLNPTSGFSVP